jgi:transposase-like protein
MKAEQPARGRRALTRYGAEGRERLIQEYAQSGLTKKAFCAQRQINLGTFYGWSKKRTAIARRPAFAQVEIATCTQAAVEVLLPNGARVGIRHQGKRDELVALIRGVAGC